MRVEKGNEVVDNLLLAKTRVAPVKTISIPRLDLGGAVFLAEMVESVICLWNDSVTVLAWVRKLPCSWSTFVARRVTNIADKVGNCNCRYLKSWSISFRFHRKFFLVAGTFLAIRRKIRVVCSVFEFSNKRGRKTRSNSRNESHGDVRHSPTLLFTSESFASIIVCVAIFPNYPPHSEIKNYRIVYLDFCRWN